MDGQYSSSSYSHLLYLNEHERANYLPKSSSTAMRPGSISFFSMTSSRCSTDSGSSSFSEISSPSSSQSSVQSAIINMPKYADDHYPLIASLDPLSSTSVGEISKKHSALFCAKEMACAHNTIIRALNSSYNHACTIQPSTQRCRNFLKFNQIMFNTLEHHLKVENRVLFPQLEKLAGCPNATEEHSRRHESFHEELRTFEKLIFDSSTVDDFDCTIFRRTIKSFAPALIQHLHDDIPLMLRMHTANSKAVRKIWSQAHKRIMEGADVCLDGPFILGCQDKTFLLEGELYNFPRVSWVMGTLVRTWHAKKYAGVWEFLPSDLQGNRRMLFA